MRAGVAWLAAFALAACGGGGSADAGVDAGPRPTNLLSLPQVQRNSGHVLTTPRVVTVTFPGDPLAPELQTFSGRLGQSLYWADVTSEYGVGSLVAAGQVVVNAPAPTAIDDVALKTFIQGHQGTDWPAATSSTVYLLYFPSSSTVTENGLTGCVDFAGYHGALADASGNFQAAYAVVVRCGPDATALDALTSTAAHELVEAVTDPNLDAFFGLDPGHGTWTAAAALDHVRCTA